MPAMLGLLEPWREEAWHVYGGAVSRPHPRFTLSSSAVCLRYGASA